MVEVELPMTAIADLLKPEIRDLLGIQLEAATPLPERSAKAPEQAEAETTARCAGSGSGNFPGTG